MNSWFKCYYIAILVCGSNPKHFWLEERPGHYHSRSRDGKIYSIFTAHPNERLESYTSWIPFLLFIKDEYG